MIDDCPFVKDALIPTVPPSWITLVLLEGPSVDTGKTTKRENSHHR